MTAPYRGWVTRGHRQRHHHRQPDRRRRHPLRQHGRLVALALVSRGGPRHARALDGGAIVLLARQHVRGDGHRARQHVEQGVARAAQVEQLLILPLLAATDVLDADRLRHAVGESMWGDRWRGVLRRDGVRAPHALARVGDHRDERLARVEPESRRCVMPPG